MSRPPLYFSNADRQRAYRERKKMKHEIEVNAPTMEQFKKLTDYVKKLVEEHNALEERVKELESK